MSRLTGCEPLLLNPIRRNKTHNLIDQKLGKFPFVYILKIFYFEYFILQKIFCLLQIHLQTKISLHILINTRRRAYENIYAISYYYLLLIRHRQQRIVLLRIKVLLIFFQQNISFQVQRQILSNRNSLSCLSNTFTRFRKHVRNMCHHRFYTSEYLQQV